MWFKRRRKTEQDHALSESLRSLQSLLSETGRHEPNLDLRHAPADDTDADESGHESPDSWPAAGPALAAGPENGNHPRPGNHDAPAAGPGTPGGSGNRWRDLNLSFDAEPAIPRVRRDAEADDTTAPQGGTLADVETEPATPTDPAYGLAGEPTEDAAAPEPEDGAPDAAAPVDRGPPHEPGVSQPDSRAAEAADTADSGDTSIITDQNRDDDYDFPSQAEEGFLVLDLEEPQLSSPTAGAETGAPSAGEPMEHQFPETSAAIDDQLPEPDDGAGADDAATDAVALDFPLPEPPAHQPPAIEQDEQDAEREETTRDDVDTNTAAPVDDPLDPAPEEAAASEPPDDEPEPAEEPTIAGYDEGAEDQLHLELESSAVSEADIPVLTNAVYVPEPPAQKQETAPGPPESPHEGPIARCIDNLRVRLQLMGLDTLSNAQERELHDSLVELLDEIEHD